MDRFLKDIGQKLKPYKCYKNNGIYIFLLLNIWWKKVWLDAFCLLTALNKSIQLSIMNVFQWKKV